MTVNTSYITYTVTSSITNVSVTSSYPVSTVITVERGQPGVGIPPNGSTGFVLAKNTAGAYDASWKDAKPLVLPSGGLTNQRLVKKSDVDYDVEWKTQTIAGAGNDKSIQFNDAGMMAGNDNLKFDKNTNSLIVGIPDVLPDNPLAIGRATQGWLQANIHNTSEHAEASADWVATSDNGDDLSNYIDMGINSSIYSSEDYAYYGPNDAYITAEAQRIIINPSRAGSSVEFLIGGTDPENHVATVDDSGLIIDAGLDIKIGAVSVATVTNRPEIYYGTGSPPSGVGLADGTLFFKY